jgi:hypothetical protein
MHAARIFLLNASLFAVGVLVLYALVQALVQRQLRVRRRFARRKAILVHDSHEAHSISFLPF